MKNINKIVMLSLVVILGSTISSCASLNPNTEGHILSELQARSGAFKGCYETALEKNRETKGTVGLELKIDGVSGNTTSTDIEESTIGDNQMNQCVSNAASDIKLPEPPGVPVEGHYDINFDFE